MTLSKHFNSTNCPSQYTSRKSSVQSISSNFVYSNQLGELKQWSTTDAVEFSMISHVTITIEYHHILLKG